MLVTLPMHACWEVIDGPKVSWVAFKTPAKVGVKGSFKNVKRAGKQKGENLKDLLTGQTVTLSFEDLFTKNPARDKNIKEAFFGNLTNQSIKARVAQVSDKFITLEILMNAKKISAPLKYSFKGNTLHAFGHIDILDFQASKALSALNKRCYALHEGKTWSHVEIGLSQDLKKCQ